MDPLLQGPDASFQTISATPPGPGGASAAEQFPLRPIVAQWLEKLKLGCRFKKKQFGDDAAECMKFFNGPYDFMYNKKYLGKAGGGFSWDSGDGGQEFPAPTFRMTANKIAEAVQLFGPVLYHRNPDRTVNPRRLPELPFGLLSGITQDPLQMQMMQMQEMQFQQQDSVTRQADVGRSALMGWMLNYTPRELDLKGECRFAVDEALIKGGGVLWQELHQPQGSPIKLIGSFYDSYDNLVLDPDSKRTEHCQWAARRCVAPVWKVEREYQLKPGSLKGQFESYNQQAEVTADEDGDYYRRRGETNDLIVYWKIYSRMGIGGRLNGVPAQYREPLEAYGDFCYLVVAEGTPYPLNLPPEVVANPDPSQVAARVAWPTPTYMTGKNPWPFAELAFHRVPNQLYPMSHFKPAMGELKFLNWVYSFIASRVQVSSRTFLAMKKSLGDDIKKQVMSGADFTILDIEATNPGTIQEMIQFLNHPEVNGDIWKAIELITEAFDKRTGLSELMYGSTSKQLRSAEEANVKAQAMNVRPDDMANKVEDWMTTAAQIEAMAIRWHLVGSDVAPLLGPAGAFYWDQLITGSDPFAMFHQLEYGIEAGSTRKPNKDAAAANMNQAMQTLFSPMITLASNPMTPYFGHFEQVNALITDWAKSMDADATPYLFPNLPPPAPPPPAEGEPAGGGGATQPQGGQAP